jgi:mRNA-degrading endonuclease toxin of MazEF toxin-antitoxin module
MAHLHSRDHRNRLSKDSGADAFQVKSISLRRFHRRLGEVRPELADAVATAAALCVGAP